MTAAESRAFVLGEHPSARVVWNDAPRGPDRKCRIVIGDVPRHEVTISFLHKSEGLAWMRAARFCIQWNRDYFGETQNEKG